MKMFKLFLPFLIFILALTSCSFKSNSNSPSDKILEIVKCLENNDKEGFKNLFAYNKIKDIENFDETLDELFDYYDGNFISKLDSPGEMHSYKERLYAMSWYLPSTDIKTSKDTYRISFYYCNSYTVDKDYEGIWSLYIIKKSLDPYQMYTYNGDGLWTPGIHIGVISNFRDEGNYESD